MVAPTYPGVYMQEKSSGPGAITGVSTSTLGLVGWTPRGRVDYPVLCTSFVDYASKFGGFTGSGLAPTMAYAYFANGGQRIYMVRAAHSDAVNASVYWSKAVTAEVLTSTATGTGLYILSTAKVPIVAVAAVSGVTVTFENSAAPASVNVFRDLGAGVLTHVAGTGTGGTGSIDYTTGEVNIQLTDPTEYVGGGGGANDVTITYSYKVATFTMAWPGLEGNDFRIRIQGSPNYYTQSTASYSAYKIMVEENVAAVGATASWQTDETFDEVVLDDATDPKYFKAIMNDTYKGSQLVTVTDYGNAQALAALNGVAVTNEDFSATISPAYDGTTKAFTYATANTVAPGTLEASFKFIETAYRIGTGDGTAAPTCLSLGKPIDAGGGAVLTAKVTVNLTLTVGGATVLYDDGAGNLKTSPFPGTTHGTVAYTTGAVTLAVAGTTVVAGTPITISAVYEDAVIVEDDANGNLSIQTPAVGVTPPAYTLNSAGTNTIDYDTKVMSLAWQIAGRPADGPDGVYATLGETVDYYTQPSDEVIYTMISGADGTATTRSDVTAAALSIDARGMYALSRADEIMQVVIADFQTDDAVCRDVITYCENMGDKFGLFTVPEGMDEQEAVNWRKFTLAQYSNKVAAPYYPHIAITDPVSEATLNIPVGGHVAGIYARTDNNKNVGKNPAGVEDGKLLWLEGLETDLTRAQVGYAYPNMVNCLVSWPQTGMAVWGCKTMEVPGGEFVYVNSRRLFQYVEKSVFNATHIHVFENNGPALWTKIRLQVTNFLMGLFNAGYFRGTTADEAFYVVCDSTNNNAESNLVYCDVGLAVSQPAEFLIFTFSQLTSSTTP